MGIRLGCGAGTNPKEVIGPPPDTYCRAKQPSEGGSGYTQKEYKNWSWTLSAHEKAWKKRQSGSFQKNP